MSAREHTYTAVLEWSGDQPVTDYESYTRNFTAALAGRPELLGSADPTYRGDAARHNPEDLLLIAVASCHMLSYLAQAALAGIQVTAYRDEPVGTMKVQDRRMRFTAVVLHPRISFAPGTDLSRAESLHAKAHDGCFIANSVNFPVTWQPTHST